MSQIQTSGPSPQSVTRRRSPVPIDRIGITESLSSPGLAVGQATDRGAMLARQMLDVLGAAGGLASGIAQTRREARYEENRIKAEQDQLAREAKAEARDAKQLAREEAAIQKAEEAALRGNGAQMGHESLQAVKSALTNDTVIWADNPEASVDSWLQAQTANLEPAQAVGFRAMRDELLAAAYAQRDRHLAQAKTNTLQEFGSAIASGQDPLEVAATARMVLKDNNAVDKMLVDAGMDAARTGNTDLLARTRAALPDQAKYKTEMIVQDNHLSAWKNTNEAAITEQFRNQVGSLKLSGATFAQQREFVAKSKGVPDAVRSSTMDSIVADEQQAISQSQKLALDAWRKNTDSQVNAAALSAFRAGIASTISPITVKSPDGKDVTYTVEEQVNAAMRTEFAEIDRRNQGNPTNALLEKIDLSARNGVPIPEIVNTLKAGGMASTSQAMSDPKLAMPPAVLMGFGQYKALRDLTPAYLDRLEFDAKTRDIYQTAALLQEVGVAGDDSDAMRQAVSVTTNPRPIVTMEKATFAAKVASGIGNVGNSSYIANRAEEYGKVFLQAGKSPKDAANLAIERIKRNGKLVNGNFVILDDARLSADTRDFYDMISTKVAKAYSKAVQPAGVTTTTVANPSDFVLEPRGSGYVLINKLTGMPASAWSRYTAEELNAEAVKSRSEYIAELTRRESLANIPMPVIEARGLPASSRQME